MSVGRVKAVRARSPRPVKGQRLQYPCLSAMVLPLWHARDRLYPCVAFFFEEWHVSQREAWSEVLRCKWSSSETNLNSWPQMCWPSFSDKRSPFPEKRRRATRRAPQWMYP